jgi:calcium-dependent protein kinase
MNMKSNCDKHRQAGCILYTLLAGFPPFHAEEDANINIMNGNYYPMEGPEWDIPTSEAKDLVRRMLTLDPEQRIDMTGVISHPWLTSPEISQVDKKAALQPMGQQYKSRIKGLVFRNKLKRFFLSNNIEAGLLSSSKDAAEFYFSQFDTDREGVINFDSMVSVTTLRRLALQVY